MTRTTLSRIALVAVAATMIAGCRPAQRGNPRPIQPVDTRVVDEYWPGGELKLRKHVRTLPDGRVVEHGMFTTWYTNGQKEYESRYIDGELDGVETSWHPNGQKWVETHYFSGKRHGRRRIWNDEGTLTKEEHFEYGKPVGVWRSWKSSGKLRSEQRFDTPSD